MTDTTTMLKEILRSLEDDFPGAWKTAARMRGMRGGVLPGWPNWCYLPFAGWLAVASETLADGNAPPQALPVFAARLAAVGTWRMSKGVYRFDPDLYEEIVDTPVEGDIPCEVLRRLPEWCVFVETPGLVYDGKEVFGFFAHLEKDAKNGDEELRLLLARESMLIPLVVHLGRWTLREGVERMLAAAERNLPGFLPEETKRLAAKESARLAEPLLSLLLYLCSANAEIGDGTARPHNPEPVRVRDGREKLFPVETPRVWDVGERIGAAIRRGRTKAAVSEEAAPVEGRGSPKRPHVRRAHWHGYWTGPRKGKQSFELRWIPPIPVNIEDDEDAPTVIHAVEEESRLPGGGSPRKIL